jgi:hypothetical protein
VIHAAEQHKEYQGNGYKTRQHSEQEFSAQTSADPKEAGNADSSLQRMASNSLLNLCGSVSSRTQFWGQEISAFFSMNAVDPSWR